MLIQCPLIATGQMSIILAPHIMFLLVDRPEIPPVLARLTAGQLTFPAFGVDPSLLVIDAAVNLVDTRVTGNMRRLMAGTLGKSCRCKRYGKRRE